MKITLDAAQKLFVLFVVQTVVVIVALGFLVFWQIQINDRTAKNELQATRISVSTTQCALAEILDSVEDVADDLGVPIVIVRPDVSHLDCPGLLNQGASVP